MRAIAFAKRNLKEIFRDPLSILFNVGFPVMMLFVFQLITGSMTPEEVAIGTPQFVINRLAPGLCVFSFSFLMLFNGMLVAKDRTTSFLERLKSSPLTSADFLIGYTLPMIPFAFIQMILCYSLSFIFGLELTGGLILSMLALLPIAIMYISLGILFGCIFNDKTIGGVASAIISFASIFGGIFMPLDNMQSSLIYTIAYIFPFANGLKMVNCVITGQYQDFLVPLLIVLAYTVVIVVAAILVFKKKMKSDKM